jgi:predicted CopG family antitoxin
MTNITLSIEEAVYKKMKQHSEIKWSEFVRKMIKKRIDELETLEKSPYEENIITMLASEPVLKKEWNNPADARWDKV